MLFENLIKFGYTHDQAMDIIEGLKKYLCQFGVKGWRRQLDYDCLSAYYPILSDTQRVLFQTMRNDRKQLSFLMTKIRAKDIKEYY